MVRIGYKVANITWKSLKSDDEFIIKTPVPTGMTGLIVKLQTASCRSWES